MSKTAKNYYEILELSSNANQDTIERMFRYLATKHHPDSGGDKEKFSFLVKAFESLRDPVSRATYDASLQQQERENAGLAEHARQAGPDTADRHELLCLFYARRRQNEDNPAIGMMTIEKMMNLPSEVLKFHLWYFREKGWVKREENGGLSITAEGVDRVEANEMAMNNHLRIEAQQDSIAIPLAHPGQVGAVPNPHAF
jgi:curved DNA-binding protein CbpA